MHLILCHFVKQCEKQWSDKVQAVFVWKRAVIPKDPDVEQVSSLSQFLHYKHQTQLPWMIQYATISHSSHFTVVTCHGIQWVWRLDYSPIKCYYPAVIRATLCVCVLACTKPGIMIPRRALHKRFARVKWGNNSLQIKLSAGWICFLLAYFLSVCLLNCYVYIPERAAHHQLTVFDMVGSSLHSPFMTKEVQMKLYLLAEWKRQMEVNTHSNNNVSMSALCLLILCCLCVPWGVWRAEENPLFWNLIYRAACPHENSLQIPQDTLTLT